MNETDFVNMYIKKLEESNVDYAKEKIVYDTKIQFNEEVINKLGGEIEKLKTDLDDVKGENEKLKNDIINRDNSINSLNDKLNNVNQELDKARNLLVEAAAKALVKEAALIDIRPKTKKK